MTETMLSKAARAIVRAEQDDWDTPADEWSLEALEVHGPLNQARAALEAIREPDAAMTKYCAWDGVDVGEWQSGIDAILSQSQEGK